VNEDELKLMSDRLETLERLYEREHRQRISAERLQIYGLAGLAAFLLIIGSGVRYDANGVRWELSSEVLGLFFGTGSILHGILSVQGDRAGKG
jgi:hypothetical protein